MRLDVSVSGPVRRLIFSPGQWAIQRRCLFFVVKTCPDAKAWTRCLSNILFLGLGNYFRFGLMACNNDEFMLLFWHGSARTSLGSLKVKSQFEGDILAPLNSPHSGIIFWLEV